MESQCKIKRYSQDFQIMKTKMGFECSIFFVGPFFWFNRRGEGELMHYNQHNWTVKLKDWENKGIWPRGQHLGLAGVNTRPKKTKGYFHSSNHHLPCKEYNSLLLKDYLTLLLVGIGNPKKQNIALFSREMMI